MRDRKCEEGGREGGERDGKGRRREEGGRRDEGGGKEGWREQGR